ncbi:FtsH protease activity modulator HflK [Roseateles sp. BYS87W]|uniref:Protein HflK n=1 Tax=Pelomonas baiyunensis TaxID=3299026 RepID=A0ABW7GVA5_9BURK
MSSTLHTPPRSPWLQRILTPVARAAGRLLNNGRNDGPPDLDELWRDFNRKLSGMFGGKPTGPSGPTGSNGGPDMKGAGIGAGLIVGVVALGWLASGFFIVQEGQQGVISSFGKYSKTVDAGFQWRLPYPFQAHEVQPVSQLRQVEVGRSSVVAATGLRDSSMLTQDENIVDIRFTVQFTIRDLKDFLFENRDPEQAVLLAAESAVREIVGKSSMDSVLYEQRDAIAADLVKSIQTQLDRLKAGIQIKNVNVLSVQPPEQVQAAFEDAFKAGQNREQTKNEAQAYANQVIPSAQGDAAKLREQAEGYKASVVATAEGDAQRFKSVLAEYQKAPQVTRDRLYIDAMQQIYSNVSKVLVDSKSNSNMLYLPLDKLIQGNSSVTVSAPQPTALPEPQAVPSANDLRSRDNQRSRDGR